MGFEREQAETATQDGAPPTAADVLDSAADLLIDAEIPHLGMSVEKWCEFLDPLDSALRAAVMLRMYRHGSLGSLFATAVMDMYARHATPADGPILLEERALTWPEIAYVKPIFGPSVSYDAIRIKRGSLVSSIGDTSRTVGNTIYMTDDEFEPHSNKLVEGVHNKGLYTLAHEMGHVWQYEHGGLVYIPDALLAQLLATVVDGDRDAAYDWRPAAKAGLAFDQWNPEMQAEMGAEYNEALHRVQAAIDGGGLADGADVATVMLALPYIMKVMAGQGAPTLSGSGGIPFDPPSPGDMTGESG